MTPVEAPRGLPRRDTWMAVILIAIMATADVVALFSGLPASRGPALIIMPCSFALVWGCYVFAMALSHRRQKVDTRGLAKMATFMGQTLALVGGLLTIVHLLLLGSFTWLHGITPNIFVRCFLVAMGGVLILMFNRMPKAMGGVKTQSRFGSPKVLRVQAWAGVACGFAMIAAAVLAPSHRDLVLPVFVLGCLPNLIGLATAYLTPPAPKA